MKLDGHAKLTNGAIQSFRNRCTQASDKFLRESVCRSPQFNTLNVKWQDAKRSNSKDNDKMLYFIAAQELSLISESMHSLKSGYLTRETVAVDLEPLKLPFHILDVGQKYHFMRIGDKQTVQSAHQEASQLIRDKAEAWLKHMHRAMFGKQHHGRNRNVTTVFRRRAVSELAVALHSLQDSFSPAHTLRKSFTNPQAPGEITDIFVYAEQDHAQHGEHDFESGSMKSLYAQAAVHASAELMHLCASAISKKSTSLLNWEQFKHRWIKLGL